MNIISIKPNINRSHRIQTQRRPRPHQRMTINPIKASWKKDMEPQSWAPEVINSRCAMVGVTSGLGYEFINKMPVYKQFEEFWPAYIITIVLITIASLYAGDPKKDKSIDKTWVEGEIINGRMAMLGFGGILALETVIDSGIY